MTTPAFLGRRRKPSSHRRQDQSSRLGLSVDGTDTEHEDWRIVAQLELRPEEMKRYLEIKAAHLMDLDAPPDGDLVV